MKKIDKHIEDLVNETLNAFEGTVRARPKPFLYTRLRARMEKQIVSPVRFGILSPVLQRVILTFIILVLAFNIYTAIKLLINPVSADTIQMEENEFIEEFYPSTPTLYSINQTSINP